MDEKRLKWLPTQVNNNKHVTSTIIHWEYDRQKHKTWSGATINSRLWLITKKTVLWQHTWKTIYYCTDNHTHAHGHRKGRCRKSQGYSEFWNLVFLVSLLFSAILTNLILFFIFMYPTHTELLFTVKPFYNMSIPLPMQPHSLVPCARDDQIMLFYYAILSCFWKIISVSDPNPVLVKIVISVSKNYPKMYYDAQHIFLCSVYFVFS